MMQDPVHRRRALRREVQISREAMRVLAPLNRMIGPWQACAARALVLAQRQAMTGLHDQRIEHEIRELSSTVAQHRVKLLQAIGELSPEGARSGRITDTLRALDSLTSTLKRANAAISARPPVREATVIRLQRP